MEINGQIPPTDLKSEKKRIEASEQPEQARKIDGEHSDADRLKLPVENRESPHFDELIRSTPDVRESRVEEIRKELEKGTYNVEAEKIAEKIIGGDLLDEIF